MEILTFDQLPKVVEGDSDETDHPLCILCFWINVVQLKSQIRLPDVQVDREPRYVREVALECPYYSDKRP